ncbi:MAG: polysaccharide biosynthesis C-terminal domain-containing protein [Ferruginibacter sp.]
MSITTNIKTFYRNPAIKAVGIYTFTNFFSKAASFLLLFIFTNPIYISPSENGLLSLFSNSMLFLMPFLSMGIIHSVSADYFKLSKSDFKDFFSTGFVIPFIVMIVSAILLFLFREKLQQQYGFPPMFAWLIPVITFLTFCNEQLLSLARNNDQPNVYLKANISKTILELGISVILVVFFAWRWKGRVTGILISYALVGCYAFYYFIKNDFIFGCIRRKFIYSELSYAVPIIIMQASIFCMSASDRFFLSHFTNDNNATVGIYSVASTFALVINVLSMALIQYIFPKIYGKLSGDSKDYRIIKKMFKMYLLALSAGLILLILGTQVAYRLFINYRYFPALQYQFLLCIGFFLWGIAYFFYSFLLYHKDKKRIIWISVCAMVCSLSLNYFLIKEWGASGAAISTVCTYSVILIITLFVTRKYWKDIFIPHRNNKN